MENAPKNIVETKEMVIGFLQLSVLMAEAFKDGLQAQDVVEVFAKIKSDEELQAKLISAYNGIEHVPAEVKDLSLAEGVELIVAILPEVKKLIQAVSKKA